MEDTRERAAEFIARPAKAGRNAPPFAFAAFPFRRPMIFITSTGTANGLVGRARPESVDGASAVEHHADIAYNGLVHPRRKAFYPAYQSYWCVKAAE